MTTPSRGTRFGYLEYLLTPTSKLSAVFGTFVGHFQIPNSPGQTPSFTVNGISDFDSTKANETQLEQNYYGVLSYLEGRPGPHLPGLAVFAATPTSGSTPTPWPTSCSTASPRTTRAAASRPACRPRAATS